MNNYETVTYELKAMIAVITLNRPKVRNSLNQKLRIELSAAIKEAGDDDNVRVIVIAGSGKGFCAGADLAEKLPGDDQDGFITEILRKEYNPIIQSINNAPKPVVGAINGAAAGFGGAIAMACDLVVMAEDAFLYSAFGAISLIPDGGSHKALQNYLGAKKAYEMMAFSQRLTAQQCLEAGIANRIVAPEQLLAATLEWASMLTEQAPLTLKLSKQLLKATSSQDIDYCLDQEAIIQNITFRSDDFAEGSKAFFEKRKPVFTGK